MAKKLSAGLKAQDEHFLDKVPQLVGKARLSIEEAEQYATGIVDPKLKQQAQDLLELI